MKNEGGGRLTIIWR